MRSSHKLLLAIAASTTSLLAVETALAQTNPIDGITTVTAEMLLNPPDGDWLMWRRTYNGWGYSPLDQINRTNVADLQLIWSWGMSPGGTQQTPLVHDGVMFLQNSDHTIQALNAATGEMLWAYQHDLPDGVNNAGERSMAIWGDNLIVATRDAGVRVFTVGFGTVTGEVVDFAGQRRRQQLDEESLRQIAEITRAEYFLAGTETELAEVLNTLNTQLVTERGQTEITAIFAGLAGLLTVLAAGFSFAWFGRVF